VMGTPGSLTLPLRGSAIDVLNIGGGRSRISGIAS
jgi:hypothetical protein